MALQLPAGVAAEIDAIRTDHASGAVTLTKRAARAFGRLASLAEASSAGRMRSLAAVAARSLVAAQPTMASLVNLANTVLWATEQAAETGAVRERLRAAADEFLARMDAAGRQLPHYGIPLLGNAACVLTHSYSQTVLDTLLAAHRAGTRLRVICTESRPVCEGVLLARRLSEAGIEVTLATDAAMFSLMAEAEICFTGADAVSGRGVVNKTGTSLLALAAGRRGREIYTLCGSEKFLPAGYEAPEEPEKPATEILNPPLPNIRVVNRYFELTPLDLLSGVVCEEGVLKPAEVQRPGRHPLHPALLSRPGNGASLPPSS